MAFPQYEEPRNWKEVLARNNNGTRFAHVVDIRTKRKYPIPMAQFPVCGEALSFCPFISCYIPIRLLLVSVIRYITKPIDLLSQMVEKYRTAHTVRRGWNDRVVCRMSLLRPI